jgi:hypothetical protein
MKNLIHISLLAWWLGGSVHAAGTDRVEIDAKQAGAVISPMLFGCNLEVTRRGIWRGLGAEMVANRKFAAVGNNLPRRWYPVPDTGRMVMDDKVVFVGKGAVRVGGDKPGGLGQQQEALAFQKSTRYTFRWWLKSEAEQSVSMRIADDKGTYSSFACRPDGNCAALVANEVTPQHTIFLEREEQPTVDEGGRLELKMPRYSVAVIELTTAMKTD